MISGSKIKIRTKTLADAQNDYIWQKDPELAWLDAAPVITMPFEEYLSAYASELRYSAPIRQSFALETLDGKHIGNCVYYNIDKKKGEAEIGIMIGNRDYWDKGYGTDAVTTLIKYIFGSTNFNRLYLKTLTSNARAQRCFQKCGLTPYGCMTRDGFDFVLMDIERTEWQKRNIRTEGNSPPE
jgi:RimJ/RimL family protein N-acetyltransferase